jgi:hypothetical protein
MSRMQIRSHSSVCKKQAKNKHYDFLQSTDLREGSINILCTDTRSHTSRTKAAEYPAEDIGKGYHFRNVLKYKVCFASILLFLQNINEENIFDLHSIVDVVDESDKFYRYLASYNNSTNGTPNFRGMIK